MNTNGREDKKTHKESIIEKKIMKNSQSGVFLFIFVEQLTPTPL